MKYSRLILAVLLMAASSMVLSGCGGKTWSFNFDTATVDQLNSWFIDSFGGTVSYDDGAVLDGEGIASPVSFDGDWTMSVTFDLDVDDDDNVYFELFPGDTQGWEPDNYIWSYFDYVGWLTEEEWYVDDTGETDYDWVVDDVGNIPGIRRTGSNTWKIVKTGRNFKTYMNGTRLCSFNAVYCDTSEDFFLNIYAELDGGELTFRSVEVKYKGNMYD